MNLKGRDFLKLLDFSGEEITYLIDLAEKLKTLKKDGVPHRYCNGKNIALIALLSPFVLFSIVFIVGIAIAGNGIAGLILKLLFAEHFGGCSGDLYDTVLLVFKYRKGCLINDDGPKQTIYIKEEL